MYGWIAMLEEVQHRTSLYSLTSELQYRNANYLASDVLKREVPAQQNAHVCRTQRVCVCALCKEVSVCVLETYTSWHSSQDSAGVNTSSKPTIYKKKQTIKQANK